MIYQLHVLSSVEWNMEEWIEDMEKHGRGLLERHYSS